MGWITALGIFGILWWMVFFVALPFGATRPEASQPGTVESAPDRPRIWLKAGITTAITVVLMALLQVAVSRGWLDFWSIVGARP
ncbi:MAG: DUF1467 family protein [Alphaproteobacteria bacterium]|nr:DUF1467 family protein [Alphaproteobacteria bacterium]